MRYQDNRLPLHAPTPPWEPPPGWEPGMSQEREREPESQEREPESQGRRGVLILDIRSDPRDDDQDTDHREWNP